MIEMSVDDKETVLPSERPGDASLPPPPQRPTQLLDKCSENHQQPLEKCISKQEGTRSPADRGSEEPEELQELQEPEKHGNDNIDNHTGPDSSTQIQNGVQQPKSQQKLNKRRSTMSSGFKHPVFGKRRRRANSESESVLPTNFYLGGNIFDPLNLNSMLDEEVNQALNAETPKSSPLPVKNRDPVEILIPRDITDPLNLNSSTAGDEGLLLSPLKSGGGGGGRRRHRNRHHGIIGVGGSGGKGVEGGVLPQIGDFSEAEKGKSETEMMLTSTSSEPPLDCVASEPPEKEALESNSISTQGAQCSSALNSSTDGGDSKRDERPTSGAPVLDTSNPTPSTTISPTATPAVPASHRQRKRKRTSSKSENFGATYCDKANKATTITTTSSGSTSTFTSSSSGVGQPQANRNQGTGLQSIQQQHPNQRKNQKNQQKPNQQHHHQQQQQKKKKFQYGNYDKYYGYRNPGLTEDPRLRTLKPEWFRGKEVLDLGCNTGRLTLSIAMNWRPSRIVGLDIDGSLIHAARKNILYFLSEMHVMKSRSGEKDESGDKAEKPETTSLEKNYKSESPVDMEVDKEGQEGEKDGVKEEEEMVERREKVVEKRSEDGVDGDAKKTKGEEEAVSASSASSSNGNCVFPVSLRISRGPIAAPPLPDTKPPSPGNFPANVSFVKGNYVLDSDLLLVTQREEFDVILCLSVTKWVHLNWGDVGLKRLFHRVYRHLRPGGTFILEPQPWNSYSKRKKLTETITKNYYSICLKPEQFSTYLISEVGFSSYELIGTPSNLSRGFQRPIYLFHKGPAPQK